MDLLPYKNLIFHTFSAAKKGPFNFDCTSPPHPLATDLHNPLQKTHLSTPRDSRIILSLPRPWMWINQYGIFNDFKIDHQNSQYPKNIDNIFCNRHKKDTKISHHVKNSSRIDKKTQMFFICNIYTLLQGNNKTCSNCISCIFVI